MSVRKIVLLFFAIGTFTCCLCDIVRRSEILNERFSVEWEADLDTEIIVFTVDVETTGYVGFGISMNPSMAGADIVMGGVRDDQTTYFADYNALFNTSPRLDDSQDWELLNATESNGRTVLSFSRKLNTCDEVGDVVITADTQYIIWAIGNTDNTGYHGGGDRRGAKIINFLDAPTPPADLRQYEIFQIRREHDLLPVDTSYWCTIHKAPNFDGIRHHIVAFNTTLASQTTIKHTHHLVLYNCVPPEGQTTEYFEQFLSHPGGECFEENPVIPSPYCKSVLYIWAVGGEMLVLPEFAGYPIGDSGRQEYFMFEVHIDNPGLETGTFETGVDLFYTSNLREIDAAVFGIAHAVDHFQIIPPRTDNFVNIAHCSSECTSALIPAEGMNLMNVMFHAHKAGKKMRTRIIRDGIELPWLAVDNHYNFDYQANRPFQEYRKVLPGDHLITECTYDTTSRPNVTIGGHPSMYEMCQAWFWHYPKGLIYCDTSAKLDLNDLFGIENYTASEYDDEPILTKPDEIAGLKYSDYLNTLSWTDDLKNRLQEALVYGPHETRCLGAYRPVSYPVISEEYVEENVCEKIDDSEETDPGETDSGEIPDGGNNSANSVQTFSITAFFVLMATALSIL